LGFVDTLVRQPDVSGIYRFWLGSGRLVSTANLTTLLRGILFISQSPLCLALNLKRVDEAGLVDHPSGLTVRPTSTPSTPISSMHDSGDRLSFLGYGTFAPTDPIVRPGGLTP
jgi:hypothetical protein